MLMMKHSLTVANISRFVAKIDDDNIQSIAMFRERLGFVETNHSDIFKMTTFKREVTDDFKMLLEQYPKQ